MNNINSLSYPELETFCLNEGIKKFRAKQIWNWLYKGLVESFDDMKNLDKNTISILKENFIIEDFEVVKFQEDPDGTKKVLLRLADGELIESVLMKYKHGYSVCVTSQIGCRIGCTFCASHLGGFKRNLNAGEIVMQVVFWEKELAKIDDRVRTIVVMGIGEPMDNLDSVLKFCDVINDSEGLSIGSRHITISTSGIVPKIIEFSEYDKQVNLAISLHAPNDEIRSSIMKINKVYNITDLIDAVSHYIDKTNRRVSFEYIMLSGINDSIDNARELAKLLRGLNCHVNLIPFNTVDEYDYEKSPRETIKSFEKILLEKKIQVSIRQTKGSEIDGACGQLRSKNA